MVRIGILGAGSMGSEHAGCYRRMAGVEVAGVFSRDPAKASTAAGPLGARGATSAAELIADETIDAIDVCLPTPVHAQYVMASLEVGKHVFCETPLTLDPQEGRRMVDAARSAGRLLQVGLLMRSIAGCCRVKAWTETGEYGRLTNLALHRLGSYLRPTAGDHKRHYSDPTTELMTFDFDFVLWVMGRPTRLAASGARWEGALGEATALLAFDDGRSATVLASGAAPTSFPFKTGFAAQFEHARFETETVIAAGDIRTVEALYLETGQADPGIDDGANPYQVELEHFVGCVRGDGDVSRLDAERALEALELSLAAQRSLASRTFVTI